MDKRDQLFDVSEEEAPIIEEEKMDARDANELLRGFEDEDELNALAYLTELMNALETMNTTSKKLPGGNIIVKSKDLQMIVEAMRTTAPAAITFGKNLYKQRSKIIDVAILEAQQQATEAEMLARATVENAKREAKAWIVDADKEAKETIANAEKKADELMRSEEIYRRAEDEAQRILTDAEVEARNIRDKASSAAFKMLTGAQNEIERVMRQIQDLRDRVNEDMD